MIFDYIDLILKLVTLAFVAGVIQLSVGRRFWSVVILGQAIWIAVFRSSFLRAMALSLGLFGKESPEFMQSLTSFLMGGFFNAIIDLFILLGAIVVFAMLAENKRVVDKKPEQY